MTAERTLLADYAVNGSEKAFREVVTRYIHLVYSTAVRLVYGDTHLAEDVVQMVFADLARLARTLSPDVTLGGWLHRPHPGRPPGGQPGVHRRPGVDGDRITAPRPTGSPAARGRGAPRQRLSVG